MSNNLIFSPENTPAPCGLWRDCAGRTGQYADLELDCKGYYTCNGGAFMGHIMCAEGKYPTVTV